MRVDNGCNIMVDRLVWVFHVLLLQEVQHLNHLPRLQDLCLADPFWGDSPVAGLCNYQTFILYLLPNLTSLDTLLLAAETKQAAQATFTKKQMYYNMRIRTLRRSVADVMRTARHGAKVLPWWSVGV